MPSRRRLLAMVAAGGLATTATAVYLGDTRTFTASPATVEQAALDRTGYVHEGTERTETKERFGPLDVSGSVRVRNHVSWYVRSVEVPRVGDAPVAVFVALSSPKVELLGATFNPLDDLNTADVLERARSAYRFVTVGDAVATSTVPVLGTEREFTSYEGRAEVLDVGLDLTIRVSKFRHGDDFIVLLGAYPQVLFWEGGRVRRLARGVEH